MPTGLNAARSDFMARPLVEQQLIEQSDFILRLCEHCRLDAKQSAFSEVVDYMMPLCTRWSSALYGIKPIQGFEAFLERIELLLDSRDERTSPDPNYGCHGVCHPR